VVVGGAFVARAIAAAVSYPHAHALYTEQVNLAGRTSGGGGGG